MTLRRDFGAPAPDTVWAGDMTGTGTGEGRPYPATVIGPYSRRLPGFAMGARHDAGLVVAALDMAAAPPRRRHLRSDLPFGPRRRVRLEAVR